MYSYGSAAARGPTVERPQHAPTRRSGRNTVALCWLTAARRCSCSAR